MSNHAHIEAALAAAVLLLGIYGITWLFSMSLPATVLGLPTWLVLFAGLYVPAYFVFRARWRQ